MSISIQTNSASMVAQQNLNTNNAFQTKTIQALTSGFRINSSGDDPAGLAVANQYRDNIAELTQGVQNANDGVSTLQIIDGGLNNIGLMLDRLKTLATESASNTFSGNRSNIEVEYQQLVQDISRQASNVGLNSGGSYNVLNNVYIGGGSSTSNAQVAIDLSGPANSVDANSLGLSNSSVVGGATDLTSNAVTLNTPGALFLAGAATETFDFSVINPGTSGAVPVSVTVTGAAGGSSLTDVLGQLNSTLSSYGINAQVGSNGQLEFSGATPFSVAATTTDTTDQIADSGATAVNGALYTAGSQAFTAKAQTVTFMNAQGTVTVSLLAGDALPSAIAKINANTASLGIYAVADAAGTGISFQSQGDFSVSGSVAAGVFTLAGSQTITPPTTTGGVTANALAAITAVNNALQQLGRVQARVGAGENKLRYAIDLANSQITNFSAAQSQIRDADVAKEAANLTKAQVLQQASVAAMAQANAAPQAVLKLLQ